MFKNSVPQTMTHFFNRKEIDPADHFQKFMSTEETVQHKRLMADKQMVDWCLAKAEQGCLTLSLQKIARLRDTFEAAYLDAHAHGHESERAQARSLAISYNSVLLHIINAMGLPMGQQETIAVKYDIDYFKNFPIYLYPYSKARHSITDPSLTVEQKFEVARQLVSLLQSEINGKTASRYIGFLYDNLACFKKLIRRTADQKKSTVRYCRTVRELQTVLQTIKLDAENLSEQQCFLAQFKRQKVLSCFQFVCATESYHYPSNDMKRSAEEIENGVKAEKMAEELDVDNLIEQGHKEFLLFMEEDISDVPLPADPQSGAGVIASTTVPPLTLLRIS